MFARYLICRGRFDEAVAAAEKARSLDPLALRAEHLGWILFMSRRSSAALVNAYVGLRDRDQTFFCLEGGISERSNMVQYLNVHPDFDFIRNDPRFADLVRRVGLGRDSFQRSHVRRW